ncbi:MAG TPA: cysteine desulfurase family protein [Candidatus Saccharimonadales bacterium]|nr:cysteine desulfurase family protein [Candidatus Saccharimonadales bacterium]
MNTIYADYAAATPVDSRVLAAMQPYFSQQFYNPSATYLAAKQVRQSLESARAGVAAVLGARVSEIIFTAGGTEANNLAIHGLMRAFPGKKVVVSAIEHESILSAAHVYDCAEVPVMSDGLLDIAGLERAIGDDTVLVSIMYANNEVGTIQPIREIAALVREVLIARKKAGNTLPLYVHTDAAQAANYLDIHVSRLGVDLMTLNGGKIYGPKQSGVLWVKTGVHLEPLVYGGGQERGLRSGTENVAGAIGFSTALQIAQTMRADESYRLQQLQKLCFDLMERQLPDVIVNGSRKKRLPNNVHITLPGQDNERVLMLLDEAGIQAAAGSACSASNEEPSHVLRAMGVARKDAQASLRFTFGRQTTEADVRTLVDVLAGIAGKS